MLFNLCLACLATLTNTFGEMTLDMKWMIKKLRSIDQMELHDTSHNDFHDDPNQQKGCLYQEDDNHRNR